MLQRLFGFNAKRDNVKTEVMAGLTSFFTMAYILAVNPQIFSVLSDQGMDNGAVFTATAVAAIIGTCMMAFYAKQPFGLAPGMGLNAMFVYNVCLEMGHTWQFALTTVLLEGLVFIALTLSHVRIEIFSSIPDELKQAIAAGIGLFIASLGLKNAGILVTSESTVMAFSTDRPIEGLVCVIGLLLAAALMIYRVRGALFISILVCTFIGILLGIDHYNGATSAPPDITPLLMQFEWSEIFSLDMLLVLATLLFIDIFDTMGTLIGVYESSGIANHGKDTAAVNKALLSDAVATVTGACLGASTTTTFCESAAGVSDGGRTGLTAFTIAVCFGISLFFAPLFLSMPAVATAPTLIIVGVLMFQNVRKIPFKRIEDCLPCFLTIFGMIASSSIFHGIAFGIISYVLLQAVARRFERLNATIVVISILCALHVAFL